MIALCAITAHGWSLRMPFQLDDFFLIPRTGAMLGVGEEPPFDDAEMEACSRTSVEDPRPHNHFLFRPTTWITWHFLVKLNSGLADPVHFHALMLLLHGASAWILYVILRDAVGFPGAAIGAAIFAIGHGGAQAISWPAAQGDQFAVFFMLIAGRGLQRHLVTGSAISGCLAALGVAGMLGSKETGTALIPAFLLLGLPSLLARDYRRLVRALLLSAGAAGVMLVVRRLTIGTWNPAYIGPVSMRSDVLAGFKEMFLHVVIPWNRDRVFADLEPLTGRIMDLIAGQRSVPAANIFATAAVALPCVVGLAFGTRWDLLRVLAIVVAFLAVLVPPFALPSAPDTNYLSRAMLPGVCMLGVLLAAGTQPLFRSGHHRLGWLLLAPIAWLMVDLAVHVARADLRAGEAIRGRIDVLDQATAHNPEAWVISVDDDEYLGSVPLVSIFTPTALKPPFVVGARRVSWRHHADLVDKLPSITSFPGPIMVYELEGQRLVQRSVSGALPSPLPPLRPGAAAGTFEFEKPIPARAVDAVRVTLSREPNASGPVAITWISPPMDRAQSIPSLGGGPVEIIVDAPADGRWVLAPALSGIRIEGASVIGVPVVIEALPGIAVRSPRLGEEYAFGARLPVVFQPVSGITDYRLFIWLGVGPRGGMTARYRSSRGTLREHEDGWLEFSPGPPSTLESIEGPNGVKLSDAEFAAIASTIDYGIGFTVAARVYALAPGVDTVIARSQWAFTRMTTLRKP